MVYGRFDDTTGRPYIDARLSIESLACDGHVSFLLDTGADSTTLMPLDGSQLRIDYEDLNFVTPMSGAGGSVNCAVEEATLLFSSDEAIYGYRIHLNICERSDKLMTLPSLLGRDVIDNWRIVYDKPNSILEVSDFRFDSGL